MISTLRYGVNLRNISGCSKFFNGRVYTGNGRSVPCISARYVHDKKVNKRELEARSKLKPPLFPKSKVCSFKPKIGCNVPNKPEVLKPVDCADHTNEGLWRNKYLKYCIAAFGAAVGLALYYYLYGSKEKSRKGTSSPVVGPTCIKVPANSNEIPNFVPYILVGGGTASFSAFRAIKSHEPKAKVMIITEEHSKPYMRPPLSKELWYHPEESGEVSKDIKFKQWNGAERSLFYEPDEFYLHPTKLMETENGGVAVCQGYHVNKVDSCKQEITLDDGKVIKFEKCLIATGSVPKTLDVFEAAPRSVKDKITKFRNPIDYKKLKEISDNKSSVVIVGSGFLGSELACSLARYGKEKDLKVFQIFHESGNMGKILPEYLSKWTTNKVEEQGVCVISRAQVEEISSVHNNVKLNLSNGKSVLADHVVLCVGCEVNTDLAENSGLEVDSRFGGFVVNAELEARKNVFVAGDAACFYDPLLGRRRVEHHDHSVVSGRLAGENMVGLKKPYTHQSMFWSDLGPEIGYEAIGLVDASLPTVGVFAKPSPEDLKKSEHLENISYDVQSKEQNHTIGQSIQTVADTIPVTKVTKPNEYCPEKKIDDYGKGVIFYLRDKKVVGVLLWNLFNRISTARQVINENKTFDDLNEVAKLFEIHS